MHDVGREHDTSYLVTELLEGRTLRSVIDGGAVPLARALDYAVQIAEGLAAAHTRGIVHRDLKPENVFVTTDGRVKILDFGLAKTVHIPDAAATTLTGVGMLTGAHVVLGTPGYMAPEQVRGEPVDHRADIFAFGCVLYELVGGRRAFGGATTLEVLSAILRDTPAPLASLSPALARIVERCLEKEPAARFQSARDLAFALETARADHSAVSDPASRRTGSVSSLGRIAGAAAALLATAIIGWFGGRSSLPASEEVHFVQLTYAAGEETAPALSPDGARIAYATRVNGSWDIVEQRPGSHTVIPISADPGRDESAPVFSPDGSSIAFHEADSDGGIWVSRGESERRLSTFGFHPSWSPDGTRLVFSTAEVVDPSQRHSRGSLWTVSVSSGAPSAIEPGSQEDAAQPAWSPSGETIAFWALGSDLYAIPAAGGTRIKVTNDAARDWSPAWGPDGRHLYFSSDRGGAMNLWRIRVDERSGRALAAPEAVTTGVHASSEQPSLSRDARKLVFRSSIRAVHPILLPFDAATARIGAPVILDSSNSIRIPADVSPDGRWLTLFNAGEPQEDIFVRAVDGSSYRRITDDAAKDRGAHWSRDGKHVFFYTFRGGNWGIWRVGVDGGEPQGVASRPGVDLTWLVLSPLQDRLATAALFSGKNELYMADLSPGVSADANTRLLPGTAFGGDSHLFPTSWSPDGMTLAGTLTRMGNVSEGVALYDLASERLHRVNTDVTPSVRWMPDGRRLVYFTDGGTILVVADAISGRTVRSTSPLPLPAVPFGFALSPDGKRIYYGGRRSEADIWMIEMK